ncbi:MAG TPA: HK97 gp10 family phage protein [Firmicutes bacterium]|nr:HK97 gp10 family phage protein [Bacillota bacterium]
MANINIDQLAAEIARGLAEYSQDVVEKVNVSSEKVGKAAVKRLKQTSPKRTGAYAKAWAMKTEKAIGQPHTRIIHAKAPHYRLTHLLEYGHAKVGGGRVEGRPHIRPAEEEVIREFTREVEEVIKRG